eukprot:TRINITY_DN12563_c0_g1_i3.p1 TRINITY_DN12563_c0_g1~~TRINITY_DN12563_c0_g1_i3.p1  ORF type:complete len:386 (-),score=8.60 TRINITY_DN12563_c0_g1_i3:361-1518(-)
MPLDDDDDDDDDEDKKDKKKKDKKKDKKSGGSSGGSSKSSSKKKKKSKKSGGSSSDASGSKGKHSSKKTGTPVAPPKINAVRPAAAAFKVLTVALDGSGQYKSIQAAVDASTEGTIIRVKAGVYDEQVQISQHYVTLQGDGMDRTIITSDKSQTAGYDIITSATVGVNGDGFVARDLTIRNTAGMAGQQAVALRVDSDQAAFHMIRVSGFQDSLFASTGRQYYKNCVIEGAVDFIFGNAAAIFQGTRLKVVASPYDTTIMASGRGLAASQTGLVLLNCIVESAAARVYLGRPWKEYSTMVYINTQLPKAVLPDGWMTWAGETWNGKPILAEWSSTGPGASPTRASWAKPGVVATRPNAYTPKVFIEAHLWVAQTGIPTGPVPIPT